MNYVFNAFSLRFRCVFHMFPLRFHTLRTKRKPRTKKSDSPLKTPLTFPFRFFSFFLVFVRPATRKNVPSVFFSFSIRLLSEEQNALNVSKAFLETLQKKPTGKPTFPKRFRRGMKKDLSNCTTFPKRFRKIPSHRANVSKTFFLRFRTFAKIASKT